MKLSSLFTQLGVVVVVFASNATASGSQQVDTEFAHLNTLIERLSRTTLLNGNEIENRLNLTSTMSPSKFLTANPYKPRYQVFFKNFEDLENRLPHNKLSYQLDGSKRRFTFFGQRSVFEWYGSLAPNMQVCAVRFTDTLRNKYELRTFKNSHEASAEDFMVTHRYHCGTCSSLRNLAVYLEKPDLTTPARSCARKLTLRGIKRCLMDTVGFDERCAETWAYNVAHSKRQCMSTCIRHYGLWDILRNNMGDAHVDENGELNPCLACDEYTSGPGFQYAAGRTRRVSGLMSAIERKADSVYPVNHSLYFD